MVLWLVPMCISDGLVWRLGGLGMLMVRAGWSGDVGGEGRGWRGMVVYGRFEQRSLMF
jgi:hypothetical protein